MSSMRIDGRTDCRVMQNRVLRCALLAFALGAGAGQAFAQCLEVQKLSASDAVDHLGFGTSVSVSGSTAVVGASADARAAGHLSGSAYLFRFDGTSWIEEQKLTASDAGQLDRFGCSVSVSGNTAVVGACTAACAAGADCGSAYVFRFDGNSWVEEQKLTASDSRTGAEFGFSVSLSGTTVLVGARFDACADGFPSCGAAYVFRFNGTSWVEEQKLTAFEPTPGLFGSSVSLSGNTIVVGAWADDSGAGSAYVFRFDGNSWVEKQKLTASDPALSAFFGFSVSVSGETAVVGAVRDSCTGFSNLSCGSAYMFRFDGTSWVEEQKLIASRVRFGDLFGLSVSVSGDTVVVGASKADCLLPPFDCVASVRVYRFNGSSWVEEQKLTASAAVADDLFGWSVSVSGDTVFVAAWHSDCTDGDGDCCGAAYVFSCVPPVTVVDLDIKPGSCPNPVNPKSNGVVPVAIVGTVDFDVATIDPDSLTLARADGVGDSVAPLSDRHGPRMDIEDVATPFDGEPCTCPRGETRRCDETDDDTDDESDDDSDDDDEESDEDGGDDCALGQDGIDDLSLKFSSREMSRAFELRELAPGEIIELVLRGTLPDGSAFEAVDCIVIPAARRVLSGLRRTRGSK